jgi:hypothetical protein
MALPGALQLTPYYLTRTFFQGCSSADGQVLILYQPIVYLYCSTPAMIPLLQTNRLLLRPFRSEDQQALLLLISEKEVAATTLCIPHPGTLVDV